MMSNKIEILVNVDDMPIANRSHVAYFDMSNETIVAIKYIADFSTEGVNNVDVLGIDAVYDDGNNIMPMHSYALTSEDAGRMAELVSQMILNDIK